MMKRRYLPGSVLCTEVIAMSNVLCMAARLRAKGFRKDVYWVCVTDRSARLPEYYEKVQPYVKRSVWVRGDKVYGDLDNAWRVALLSGWVKPIRD